MYCVRKMTEDLYWVGASERRLNLFENAYPLTNGVSYNSAAGRKNRADRHRR